MPSSCEAGKCEHAVESRSTSAGSRASEEVHQQGSGRALSSLNPGLPDYEYPVSVIVRNTFIDTQVPRNISLDGFFEERRIKSCISCPVPSPDDEDELAQDEPERPAEPQALRRAITTGAQTVMATVAAATSYWMELECVASAMQPLDSSITQPMPRVLMLSEALPEPDLGSPEMPTVGSAGHNMGTCKPCAFFHSRGCENGLQCPFCHLCAPDEKRKRQKAKVTMLRDMRHQQRRQVRF